MAESGMHLAPRYRCSVCKKNLDDRVMVPARIDDEGLVVIYCGRRAGGGADELLGKVVLFDGHLARIVSIGEGRTVYFDFIEEPPCKTCGHQPGASALTHAPLFQQMVQPVETLSTTDAGAR